MLGVLELSPTVVSPDDVNVTTADRTVTDPNMNSPLFVGTGPDGELSNFPGTGGAPDANGERIKIRTGQGLGTFIVALTNNPIAAGGFTPLADRDDDGDIDINDLEIVLLTAGGLVAGDITVANTPGAYAHTGVAHTGRHGAPNLLPRGADRRNSGASGRWCYSVRDAAASLLAQVSRAQRVQDHDPELLG